MSEFSEDPAKRAELYIAKLEDSLEGLAVASQDTLVKSTGIRRVSDAIEHYLHDARFYLSEGKAATSLASVAYAEGLLDALKFLELTS
jgi:FAD synthetase